LHDFEAKKRQILERVDLAEIVSEHVTLKRSGRRLVGLCPFHSEKTPSFTVSPEQGLFKCFGCGKGGDVFSFLQYRENIPFVEAMRFLADRVGIELGRVERRDGDTQGATRGDIAKVNAWAADFFRAKLTDDATGRDARSYLADRGFAPKTIEHFQLGLACDRTSGLVEAGAKAGFSVNLLVEADVLRRDEESGRTYETFRNRLMFPIRDSMNRVIGFGGRTLGDDRAKYLNTRQTALFDKGRSLYGVEAARSAIVESGRAIIVEGYTDCIACHQAGVQNVIATLGTAMTESHAQLLRRFCDEVVLLFDSDKAGIAAADRAIRVALPACIGVKLARIPDGKDPADFLANHGAEAFADVLKDAVDALEFKWLTTLRQFDGEASDAKRREAVLDFVGVVSEAAGSAAIDSIQLGLIVNQVAHLLRIDRDEARRLIQPRRPRRASPGEMSAMSSESGLVSGSGSGSARDAEGSAWSTVLEVLVNEPGLVSLFEAAPDLGRIENERDRRIAVAVFEAASDPDLYRLSDVLARCVDALDSQRVEQLARLGAARGNFEATLRVALARLEAAEQTRAVDVSRARVLSFDPAGAVTDETTMDREKLSLGTSKHRHFAPRRLIRQAVVQEGRDSTDTKEQRTSVTEQT
jgi:DNA primase